MISSTNNAPVKLFCPHPPRASPGTLLFGGLPRSPYHFIFALPRPIETNLSFFECPALFYHTHFFSDPGAGGVAAEQFDRRKTHLKKSGGFLSLNDFQNVMLQDVRFSKHVSELEICYMYRLNPY